MLPLGIVDGQTYDEAELTLESGDLLLLYTDGITEAAAPAKGAQPRDLFGTDRLDQLLLDCRSGNTGECIDRIKEGLRAFCENAAPADDQTLIAIRCV